MTNKQKFEEKYEDIERKKREIEQEKAEQEKEYMNTLKSDEAYRNLEKEFFEKIKTCDDI